MEDFDFDVWQSIKSKNQAWYRNVQPIAVGGNAATYIVLESSGPNRGSIFALKIFLRLGKEERRERFLEEIDFLQECEHPNIMRVYDSGRFVSTATGEERRFPFVVAEYLPKTLSDVIRAGTASISEKLSYTLQLLSALAYLHDQDPQVVHRDIKPTNIFVKGGTCVLGDFGLMKILGGADDEDQREVVRESLEPGVPFFYRSPDLVAYANGQGDLTTRSDVFQLGLALAKLFTGWNPAKRPHDPLDPVELEPLRDVPGALGDQVIQQIDRMLVEYPSQRPIARTLLREWQGIFEEAVQLSHELEGKVL